jgi:hypothetical protein
MKELIIENTYIFENKRVEFKLSIYLQNATQIATF